MSPRLVYQPHIIRALASSPLISPRLQPLVLTILRANSVIKRYARRTHRGRRSGSAAKRARLSRVHFQLSQVNARSLSKNSPSIVQLILSSSVDVLAVTESWLSSSDGDSVLRAMCPTGYQGLNFPRSSGKRGGGIAIILRNTVHPFTVESPPFQSFEYAHLVLKVRFTTTCLRLIVIYRPPGIATVFLDEFSQLLEMVLADRAKLIIVGDLNLHVEKTGDPAATRFLSLLDAAGLEQHVSTPTHLAGGTLDLVITRKSDRLIRELQVGDLTTDHYAVHSLLRVSKPPLPIRMSSTRRLRNIDIDGFTVDLLQLPLFTQPADTVAGLIDQYNRGLSEVLDQHAPLTTRRTVVRPPSPWRTPEIAKAKRFCRYAERRKQSQGGDGSREICRAAANNLSKLLQREKTNNASNQVEACLGDPRALFQVAGELLGEKSERVLPAHNSLTSLLDSFADFFSSKVARLDGAFGEPRPMVEEYNNGPDDDIPPFRFQPVTSGYIAGLILRAKSTTCALDPIPSHLIKRVADAISVPIASLVNKSFDACHFPEEFREAIVTPLLKKPSLPENELSSYRPISNVSFVSKILERCASEQLAPHLEQHGLLPRMQSAYRPRHSTETALLRVQDDLLMEIDGGGGATMALLDLSAAFDTVSHSLLLQRLSSRCRVSPNELEWFRSYLTGRTQRVRVKGESSFCFPLACGVPQGSVLGPLLFIAYTAPLEEIARRYGVHCHLYADDTQLYVCFRIDGDHAAQLASTARLTACITEMRKWLEANRLTLNDDKTVVATLSSGRSTKQPLPLRLPIGQSVVSPSTTALNLGVIFDAHLSMEKNVNDVCRRAYYHLRRISRIRPFLSQRAAKVLTDSLVLSRLDYCNALHFGLPECILNRLQMVQNSAARHVVGSRRRDHVTPILKLLSWLPIRARIELKILTFVYRCIHGIAPMYLSDLVHPYNPAYTATRSSTSTAITLASPRSRLKSYGDRAFSRAGPKLWNALPIDIRTSPSLGSFRNRVVSRLLSNCFS